MRNGTMVNFMCKLLMQLESFKKQADIYTYLMNDE